MDPVATRVTWSAGDSAPGARGTVCLGTGSSFPMIACVFLNYHIEADSRGRYYVQ